MDYRVPSPNVQLCLDRAARCERLASATRDWDAKVALADATDHWRALAQYYERSARDGGSVIMTQRGK